MPFLRFTRDKRGYEHFYLVESMTTRRGKPQTRVLYWFRTPPNVKVGREPFADNVRRELELQNPDVRFDWPKILATPIPSADVERWRERRRVEKAARAARRAAAEEPNADAEAMADETDVVIEADAGEPGALGGDQLDAAAPADTQLPSPPTDASALVDATRRRRRRRRGRKHRAQQSAVSGEQSAVSATDEAPDDPVDAEPDEGN